MFYQGIYVWGHILVGGMQMNRGKNRHLRQTVCTLQLELTLEITQVVSESSYCRAQKREKGTNKGRTGDKSSHPYMKSTFL